MFVVRQRPRAKGATRRLLAAVTILASSVGLAPAQGLGSPNARASITIDRPAGTESVLVGAGDIAACGQAGDEATAALLDGIDGTVFTTGDNAYSNGSRADFANCYNPSWGRHRNRTKPSAGNHEYNTSGASAYYTYFGGAAGPPGLGYYSYDLGSWHVVVLNSNCEVVGGCGVASTQVEWLRADLATTRSECIAAYWHHPRFSSAAEHGSDPAMSTFWAVLHDYGADVILNGHDHLYERFAPQNAAGNPDPSGPRQFTVGTGGGTPYGLGIVLPSSERRIVGTYGVLALSLQATRYDWEFVPVAGATTADSGSASCHVGRNR
jgi:acid phosphatase type 7